MWRECDRLRADSRFSFNFICAATTCIVNAARATFYGLVCVWVSFLLGAATACIVNAARCDRLRHDSRLRFNFVGAATACILNVQRRGPSSG